MPQHSTAPFTNRRRHQRVPFSTSVIFISSGEVSTLPARDLGAGGIYVYAPQAPRVGSQVRVEFGVGRGEIFSVLGTVIRDETGAAQGRPGFAVRFEVSDDVRERIGKALLDKN